MTNLADKLVVVVDDEPELINTVSEYLVGKGLIIKGVKSSEELFTFLEKETPDLFILDLMLPGGMHGFDICKKLKNHERFSSIPILILSANSEEQDKVSGLDLGADDYMVKPFSLNELYSRIKAILRRSGIDSDEEFLKIGDNVKMDLKKHEVSVGGRNVELTPSEFRILQCLASRKGQVFTRDRILGYLWGEDKIVVQKTIDVHIRHLREKLGEASRCIKNVRGVGYKIEESEV